MRGTLGAMRHLFVLFAIATVPGCSSGPTTFKAPADINPPATPRPASQPTPTVVTVRPGASTAPTAAASRSPIALARAIEPKESLLANPLTVELVAGGDYGDKDGTGADAQLADPFTIALDPHGNLIVVQDGSHRLRRVSPTGVVTTVLGEDEKPLEFTNPEAIAFDRQGNLYVGEGVLGNRIKKVSLTGVVTTLAGDGQQGFKDGRGDEVRFSQINSLCVAPGGTVYISESGGLIRKMTPDGDVSTLAGNSRTWTYETPESVKVSEAYIQSPRALVLDGDGRLIFSESYNGALRWISPDGLFVKKLLANGSGFMDGATPHCKVGTVSQFAIGSDKSLYIADASSHAVRRLSPEGVLTTLVGDGYDGKLLGKNDRARLHSPAGVTVTAEGTLYIADSGNNRIVKVQLPK